MSRSPISSPTRHASRCSRRSLAWVASLVLVVALPALLPGSARAEDEPTTERLVEILLGLPQAMIVVSHDPHFRRRIATRVLHLKDRRTREPDPTCAHGRAALP